MKWFSPNPDVITLDFVPQRRLPGLLGWVVLCAASLAVIAVLFEYQSLGEQVEVAQKRLDRETRHLDRTRQQALLKQREKIPDIELRRAGELAARLHNRKLAILTEVEAASDEDVALLSLSQSASKAQMKLTGEARNLQAAFAFARRLAARPGMRSAQVDGYEFKRSGSIEVVAFSLNAIWKEAL